MVSKSCLGYETILKEISFDIQLCGLSIPKGEIFGRVLEVTGCRAKCSVTALPTCSYQLTAQGNKCHNSHTKYP